MGKKKVPIPPRMGRQFTEGRWMTVICLQFRDLTADLLLLTLPTNNYVPNRGYALNSGCNKSHTLQAAWMYPIICSAMMQYSFCWPSKYWHNIRGLHPPQRDRDAQPMYIQGMQSLHMSYVDFWSLLSVLFIYVDFHSMPSATGSTELFI